MSTRSLPKSLIMAALLIVVPALQFSDSWSEVQQRIESACANDEQLTLACAAVLQHCIGGQGE